MLVLKSPQELIQWRKSQTGFSIGFVPTMGALHAGHESLLEKARSENEKVILSIFVNPTQFNDSQDFAKYPQTWESDLEMARRQEVDVVFAPMRDQMYPDDYKYKIIETDFSKLLCGKDRPGHFDGVLTVVMKLFMVTSPTRAYFGEKDFQQLSLIQGMVEAFFLPLEIVPVKTKREASGLAMSSRNMRLSPADRDKAALIYKALLESPTAEQARQKIENSGYEVDYVTDLRKRRFAAVRVGEVRLIDNVELK